MAKDVSLLGAVYLNVPAVVLPKNGGGQAVFTEVSDTTATASDVVSGKYFYTADGTKTQGTITVPVLQEKTNIAPTTSSQTITPDSGYDGLSSVQINAMPSGSASTPATTITANPVVGITQSTGLVSAAVNYTRSITPTVSAGYVSSGTAGNVTASGSGSLQLTTKAATTYTPTTTNQTIAQYQWLTGAQTILGDSNLTAENIKKDVSIFGVTGTYEGSGGGGSITFEIRAVAGTPTIVYMDSAGQIITTDTVAANDTLTMRENTIFVVFASTSSLSPIAWSGDSPVILYTLTAGTSTSRRIVTAYKAEYASI